MIERTFDHEFVNRVCNHPDVRSWLGGEGRLDFAPFLSDRNNIALATEHGCFLFHRHLPHVYEVHTAFLPGGRGRHAVQAALEAAEWMFVRTDCMDLLTQVPIRNRAADWLARKAGFQLEFEREAGLFGPTRYYALRYWRWASQCRLAETGRWFHKRLDRLRHEAGIEHEAHPDDDAHDRYVGIACAMILAGNVAKGIALYNQWARFAGYQVITVLSRDPLVIDIGNGRLRVERDTFYLEELCQEQQ